MQQAELEVVRSLAIAEVETFFQREFEGTRKPQSQTHVRAIENLGKLSSLVNPHTALMNLLEVTGAHLLVDEPWYHYLPFPIGDRRKLHLAASGIWMVEPNSEHLLNTHTLVNLWHENDRMVKRVANLKLDEVTANMLQELFIAG